MTSVDPSGRVAGSGALTLFRALFAGRRNSRAQNGILATKYNKIIPSTG
jgi:hypothetical protein